MPRRRRFAGRRTGGGRPESFRGPRPLLPEPFSGFPLVQFDVKTAPLSDGAAGGGRRRIGEKLYVRALRNQPFSCSTQAEIRSGVFSGSLVSSKASPQKFPSRSAAEALCR